MPEPLAIPQQSALLIMECQKGILDPRGKFHQLYDRVREKGIIPNIARIAELFRATGRPVVHCLALGREDGRGRIANAPLLRLATQGRMVPGSQAAEPVEGLGPAKEDFQVGRLHGASPFHGTELDPILRSAGVTTVVATGVSTNIGVLGLVIEAVNHGYEVVLPTDCVAGVPEEYEKQQLRETYRLLARFSTADEVCAAARA